MRKINFLTLLLILVLIVSACGGGEDETATRVTSEPETTTTEPETSEPEMTEPETMSKASYKDRTILVGTMHYPPFETVVDGEFGGPGTDVVMEVFNRLGYDYKIEEFPWARMLDMMQSGELDVIVDAYITPERSAYMTYSEIPYGSFPQAFFARKDANIEFDGSLNSINNYTIGITRGYAYGEMLDAAIKNNEVTYEEADSAVTLFEKLVNNRVDIAADTSYTGSAMIKELGAEDKIIMLEPYFDSLFSYIAFSKANNLDPLKEEYDVKLKEVIEDGTLKSIFEKYDMADIADIIIEEVQ